MAKQLYPNIVRGGMAIPLGNNYYFMKGRKHNQGGIDIGKDLEVEGGEIMKLDENNVKVFSAVPFLNGKSPVEKILGGENPNKVFAQQERFKKVNKINDDGTKAKLGKRKITTQTIPESEQYAVTTPDGQRKVFNNKEEAQQYITANTPKGYSLYDTTNYGSNIDKGQTAILDRNTEREIEKATEEEIRTNARKANIESNKEYAMEALNAIPIIGDGMDIYSIVKDAYNKNYGNAALTAGMMVFPFGKFLKPVGKGIKNFINKGLNVMPEFHIGNWYSKMPKVGDENATFRQFDKSEMDDINEVGILRPETIESFNKRLVEKKAANKRLILLKHFADDLMFNRKTPFYGIDSRYPYLAIGDINDPSINWIFRNHKNHKNIFEPHINGEKIIPKEYFDIYARPKTGIGWNLISKKTKHKYGGKMNRQKAPFGKGETYIQESNKNVKPNSPFRTKEDEKVSYLNRLYYSKINPLHGYPQGYIDAATNPIYLQALIEGRKTPNEMTYIVEDSVGDAAWRKRLGLSYDKKFLIDNGDGSVKLHKNRENEIPVDTNLYINRINSSKDAIKRITKQIDEINTKKYNGTFDKNDEEELKYLLEDRSLINAGINVDKETLEALRKTYKTGKAVTVNEFGYNSRNNSINGDSPLNMLQNYGIQYDKNKNVMRYFDTYDFNQFDPFVPGKPFDFKGEIKLNKKQLGGKANIYRLDSNGKSGLRMNISTGDETKARKKALLGTEDLYLSINDSYRHFVDRSKFMEEWRKRNMLYANNPIGDKPDVNKLAKEIVTKPSNAIFIEAPKDIKINYSQGLKDYLKNATTIKPSINWNKIGTAIKPYAGSIIDTVGNIATSLINASTLNKMKYSKQPIPQIANKLKTSVNINPQLKTLNESYNQYTDYINNNTASSKVAREALQRARIKNVLDTNTLYATKENAETELINKDRINQQTVANANVDNYNKWLAGKAEFNNAILDKKSENIVGAINNITSSFNTSINNIKKDRQFNNNLISVLAANPNVNPEYLRALGADWVTDKMIEDWKLANKKK